MDRIVSNAPHKVIVQQIVYIENETALKHKFCALISFVSKRIFTPYKASNGMSNSAQVLANPNHTWKYVCNIA